MTQVKPSLPNSGESATLAPAPRTAGAPGGPEATTFEDAIARLGQIVEQLERGDLPLEASLGLFEEGIRLTRVSQHRLDRADKRIEELLRVDGDGEAVTRKFDAKLDGGSGGT
jgi:exodeoxyribonuclease VII small subunit